MISLPGESLHFQGTRCVRSCGASCRAIFVQRGRFRGPACFTDLHGRGIVRGAAWLAICYSVSRDPGCARSSRCGLECHRGLRRYEPEYAAPSLTPRWKLRVTWTNWIPRRVRRGDHGRAFPPPNSSGALRGRRLLACRAARRGQTRRSTGGCRRASRRRRSRRWPNRLS